MKRMILVLLCILLLFPLVLITQHSASGDSEYVGSETCKGCHEGYFASYSKSIHAKKAIMGSPASWEACESCHGPGGEHAGKGGGRGVAIFAFGKKIDTKEKSSRCLRCHEESKKVAFWDVSKHKSMKLSCDNCHSIHSGKEKNLRARDPELCFNCHTDIRVKTNKQSHHPIKEGKVRCYDCHNPHGSFGTKMIKADAVNELCYKCHAEKRGPFMWQHPPVEENCLNCHTPHGSNHLKLMNQKVPLICQGCHDVSRHPGTIYTNFQTFQGSSPSNRMIARACLNCHSNIHGSVGPAFPRGRAQVR
jgi:DmsE family decaheme c-type cytochrome